MLKEADIMHVWKFFENMGDYENKIHWL